MTRASDIDEAFSQVGWQVESGMKLCSRLVGFLTIWLASQSDMTLYGKLSSWGIQLPMWAGNLILVSDIHEMHIQLWAGQCNQV